MSSIQNILRKLGKATLVLVGVYGVLMTLFLLLRPLVGESWLIVALFNSYLPALFFPSMAFLLIGLILRRWRVTVLQLPALLGFMLLYSNVMLPPPDTTEAGELQFTLLTFNISTKNADYSDIERIIRETDADIVAVQELNSAAAEYLAPALNEVYPYQALYPEDGYSGQGVFSRFPLSNDVFWQIELGHMRVDVEVQGTSIALYSVHPVHPFLLDRGIFNLEPNTREINDILARTAQESGRVIVVGDFNMSDMSDNYAHLHAAFGDAFRAEGGGLGLTFPVPVPLARLDYVFYNSGIIPVEARVGSTGGGSDHYPLWVQLSLDTP
jgi:endonuclease/exonuclease/phosphatase (EEP) superfamily protein YafD